VGSTATAQRIRVAIDRATLHDVSGIHSLMLANKKDTSLLQRSRKEIQLNIRDYVVATDEKGRLLGCAATHFYTPKIAEQTALALSPLAHGKGIGPRLIEATEAMARERGAELVWLITPRPEYFLRLGYRRMSRFRLPRAILMDKLQLLLRQAPSRWIPGLFWGSYFMEKPLAGNTRK
jgi:amino-acid N-acetyltransferase